jgi:hypothetical protein
MADLAVLHVPGDGVCFVWRKIARRIQSELFLANMFHHVRFLRLASM